jgi:hypothetical protein
MHMLRKQMKKLLLETCAFLLLSIKFLVLLNAQFLYYDSLSCALRTHVNMTLCNFTYFSQNFEQNLDGKIFSLAKCMYHEKKLN